MILDSIKGLASEQTIPADAKPQRTSHNTTTTAFVCSTANIDQDDDGLIEICDLEGLNAIRYQLDGSGYNTSHSTRTKITAGCPEDGCKGYELRKNLDFNDDASYSSIANKVIWTEDEGWDPIGYFEGYRNANNRPFTAIFEGNDHTISNLMIDRPNTDGVGLFSYAEGVTINKVGLLSVKIKGDRYVGGLVGLNSSGGTITNSYATGAVEGTGSVGGLVGWHENGTIRNSYAMSAVTGYGQVGGLVGYSQFSRITNSYATGAVKGSYNVGGLVGYSNQGTITNSYATGAVKGIDRVGGLVGANWNHGTITNSYATGDVDGNTQVGGLVGANWNHGTITNSYATGAVTGTGDYVGGLVGWNRSGTITDSYATGAVEGGDNVGGLVGWNRSGTITNSYWNTQTSGQPRSAGGIGKTTEELQSLTPSTEIYDGWSATDWDFGTSNQYPALKYRDGTLLPGQGPLALLEQLAVSPGTLSPSSFDPKTHKYDVMVEYNVDSITLNTTATGATIHITSNTSDLEVNTTNTSSVTIPLTIAGDTIITIEVTNGEQRPTRYTITVSYNVPGNLVFPSIDVTNAVDASLPKVGEKVQAEEGQRIKVKVDLDSNDSCTSNVKCKLGSPDYPSLSSVVSDAHTLEFTIPVDFVEANKLTQDFVVVFAIGKNRDIASKETTFIVQKINNGSISNKPTLVGSQLIAPDLSSDPDKGAQESSVRYQWQRKTGGWVDIGGATASTYTPGDMTEGEEYRVQISYTDGQGYCYGVRDGCKGVINSEAIRNIDVDDDGLIEIRSIDDLDAIRNNLAGTSYKTDEIEIAAGCPADGCKGYELTKDLDFNDNDSYSSISNKVIWTTGEGWQPIGDSEPFSSIFKGNNYTISNLMINREGFDNIGLFSKTSAGTKIDRVHLYNIEIAGYSNVGGLVGLNSEGKITNSSVVNGTVTGSGGFIGGLVGANHKEIIKNSSVTNSTVTGKDYIGGLVGVNNEGKITNSSVANGTVTGKDYIGGLVGANYVETITNSSVTNGTVTGEGDYIGGLAGSNSGSVSRSYASVRVSGTNTMMGTYVGGLVGENRGQITDSYAVGDVSGIRIIGGLVGGNADSNGSIENSYAAGTVTGTSSAGGLVGYSNSSGNITDSYWDKTTSGMSRSAGGTSKTTIKLQSPMTATGIYSSWSNNDWDFGTREQYPALKNNNSTLLAGQRLGLQSLQISGNAVLIETFKNTTYEYTVLASNDAETIQITPTAADPTAIIRLGTNDNLVNKQSFETSLAPGDSTITIEVKTNNRKVTYTFEVMRAEVQIIDSSNMPLYEGDEIDIEANTTIPDDISLVEWEWMEIDRLLATTTTKKIKFSIPTAYIDSNVSSVMVTFEVTGTFPIGGKTLESSAEVELTINKKENGSLETGDIGALTLNDAKITAPDISKMNEEGKIPLDQEKDGMNENPDISYHWQKWSNNDWENVSTTTINIYEVGEDIPDNTEYRVLIRYTDGQGYDVNEVVSNSINYVDIDRDNDGLIEIETREELDAIRHQLDGNGYKANASAAIIIEGCPIIIVNNEEQRQCKGYELKAHIDLSGGEDWEPIGDTSNQFNAIFEGNHYTISNLTIDSPDSDNVGFFGTTTRTAEIRNVGLLSVTKIAGRNNVGGLIGSNQGKVIGSYVIVAKREGRNIYGGNNVGGLIGHNEGKVVGSYVISVKGDGTNIFGMDNVGGLVGFNSNTTITESYAIVKKIVGDTDRTGGLVGKTSGGEISNSYAKVGNMKVRGVDICPRGSLIGKLVGTNDATNPSVIIKSKMAGDCGASPLFD